MQTGPSSPIQTRNRRSFTFVVAAGVSVAVVIGLIYGLQPGTRQGSGGPGLMNATCGSISNSTSSTVEHNATGAIGSHAYFLVVASDPSSPYAGFNGSYYVPLSTQWPLMNVRLGQEVSIHVINCGREPHGFAITFYDDNSLVAVQPGKSYDVTFTATKAGTFRVYCDIYCAIHAFMQNGALIVK